MSDILNRDYVAVINIKNGNILEKPKLIYFNEDKNTSNLYVKLNENESDPLVNLEGINVKMNIVKPSNNKRTIEATFLEDKKLYEFDLPSECTNIKGTYKIEFIIYTEDEEVFTNSMNYTVKTSIFAQIDENEEREEKTLREEVENLKTFKIDKVEINGLYLDFYANEEKVYSFLLSVDTSGYDDTELRGLINTNARNIESNARNIESNADSIGVNARNIESNARNIEANSKNIESINNKLKETLVNVNVDTETLILNLTKDKYQKTTLIEGTEIKLPVVEDFIEIHLFFDFTSETNITLPQCKWQSAVVLEVGKSYELIFTYTTEWLGGCIAYE